MHQWHCAMPNAPVPCAIAASALSDWLCCAQHALCIIKSTPYPYNRSKLLTALCHIFLVTVTNLLMHCPRPPLSSSRVWYHVQPLLPTRHLKPVTALHPISLTIVPNVLQRCPWSCKSSSQTHYSILPPLPNLCFKPIATLHKEWQGKKEER